MLRALVVLTCGLVAHGLRVPARAQAVSGSSRRSVLAAVPLTFLPLIARADDDEAPPPPPPPPPPPVRSSISYEALSDVLAECRSSGECGVSRVEFTVNSGEEGFATVDGVRLRITNIPADNPNNDSSPLKLAARLRDAKVPYTFPFSDLSRFREAPQEGGAGGGGLPSFPLPTIKLPSLPF